MNNLTPSQMGKRGQKVLREKHGEGYGEVMADKARRSHETQRNNIRVELVETLGRPVTDEEVQEAYSEKMRNRARGKHD